MLNETKIHTNKTWSQMKGEVMIQIYLSNLHCHAEEDSSASDEPYVLVTAVNLVPLPAFDVIRYGPFEDVDDEDGGETHSAPGIAMSFWGINGSPAALADPDQVIFVVALMEHDAGRPGTLQGIVKGIVGGSVFGSIALDRRTKVASLLRDVSSALGTPSGPSLDQDNPIGEPQELRFSREELIQAESGQRVRKTLDFEGGGGRYSLTFEARNPNWQGFELAPSATVSRSGGIGVVSRIPGHMEVFAIGANGSVQDKFWYDDGQHWRGFELAPAGWASTSGGITAVSRIPGHMEVFFVGANGSVQVKFWYDDGQHWRGFELQPAGSASPTGKIAAVSRIPQSMELWYTGAAGQLRDNFWYE